MTHWADPRQGCVKPSVLIVVQTVGAAKRAQARAIRASLGKMSAAMYVGDELSPERDITDVRVSEVAFLEIKAIVASELEEKGHSPYRPYQYDPHASHMHMKRVLARGAELVRWAARVAHTEYPSSWSKRATDTRVMAQGQCCSMCPTLPNGGWLGSEPFQDPRSEEQMLNDQINDPELMRTAAFGGHTTTNSHRIACDGLEEGDTGNDESVQCNCAVESTRWRWIGHLAVMLKPRR